MADGMGTFDQFSSLAKIGFRPRGVHKCVDLSAFDDGTGVDGLGGASCDRQRFAGEGGLVDLDRITLKEPGVGGYDVAVAQAYHVTRHQFPNRELEPATIAKYAGLEGKRRPEGTDRVTGLVFLPEADHRIGDKQGQDDAEIRPVTYQE